MIRFSVVIPVFKAEGCLAELYRRLKDSLENISEDFEIIFVEDCSGDNSWSIIADICKTDKRVKGIKLSRNFGQHFAITAGIDHSRGEWVIIMDCDLQDQPEEIPRLYAKAKEGYDMVIIRRVGRKDTLLKRFTSWSFYKLFNFLSGSNYDWQIGNYRIMSDKVVDNFRLIREQLRFFPSLAGWLGFSVATIDAAHAARFQGKTSYTFSKLWRLAIDTIIAYSDKPLRMTIQLGFLMAFCSFMFGGYIFYRAIFFGFKVVGWGSLMVSLFFIGGLIIFNLGIIGIYLGKTFDEAKKRPLYIVSKKIGYD